LNAIPRENLKTVVDESYVAVGGLGPDLSRLVSGGNKLVSGARKNLAAILNLIDQTKPIFDSQIDSADSIQARAAHLATMGQQVQAVEQSNSVFSSAIPRTAAAFDSVTKTTDRLEPALPGAVSNLGQLADVGITYRDNIEALLVQIPQMVADSQGAQVADM